MDTFNLEQPKPNFSQDIPDVLNQISRIYHESVSHKHYRTPAGMTQPSIFQPKSSVLQCIDGSCLGINEQVLKMYRSRLKDLLIVWTLFFVIIGCAMFWTVSEFNKKDPNDIKIIDKITEFFPLIIEGVTFCIFFPLLLIFYKSYKIVKKGIENKDTVSIANLVNKIDFSEVKRTELEKLMKPRTELYEIYRYKYYNDFYFMNNTMSSPITLN